MASAKTSRFNLSRSIPKVLRSRYMITGLLFAVYITFFDHYSLLKRHELSQTLDGLEREKLQYAKTIESAKALQATIDEDEERFARERYFMKRSNEDVYVID